MPQQAPAPDSLAGRDLVQVHLPCTDLAASVAYYRDVLGLPFLFETNGMAFFQLGACRLMVGQVAQGGPLHPGVIYVDAPDMAALGPALEARGARFRGPADRLQRTETGALMLRFLIDPDGNMIGLMGIVPD